MAVFREEKDEDGISKTLTKSNATFPLVVDTPAAATAAYSTEGFHTYIIDPAGKVIADLPGTKMKRPSPKKILAALKNAKQAPANK